MVGCDDVVFARRSYAEEGLSAGRYRACEVRSSDSVKARCTQVDLRAASHHVNVDGGGSAKYLATTLSAMSPSAG